MRLENRRFTLWLFAFICLVEVAWSAEVDIPAKPLNHVVDLAGIIDPNVEASLNGYLLELEQKTTVQMVILTIDSLGGKSIEDFSISIAHEKWRLGQAGKDNGLLLLVSLQDRQYRFEVGYGLEGVLTDAFVSRVGRQYLVPYLRDGDYSKGIAAAALVLINEVASNAGVEITGMPTIGGSQAYARSGREEREPTFLESIFTTLFIIAMIYLFIRHPRLFMLFLFMNVLGGGRRSSWGGGGGGFGGGGFGGGGGGGFGGGGATGRW